MATKSIPNRLRRLLKDVASQDDAAIRLTLDSIIRDGIKASSPSEEAATQIRSLFAMVLTWRQKPEPTRSEALDAWVGTVHSSGSDLPWQLLEDSLAYLPTGSVDWSAWLLGRLREKDIETLHRRKIVKTADLVRVAKQELRVPPLPVRF